MTTINNHQYRKLKQRQQALNILREIYQVNSKYYDNNLDITSLLSFHREAKTWLSHRGFQLIPDPNDNETKWQTASLKQKRRWIGKPFANWFDPLEVKMVLASSWKMLNEHLQTPTITRLRITNPCGRHAEWIEVDGGTISAQHN
jgi:hypothetical protein